MERTPEQIAKTEALFRNVNEEIRDASGRFEVPEHVKFYVYAPNRVGDLRIAEVGQGPVRDTGTEIRG